MYSEYLNFLISQDLRMGERIDHIVDRLVNIGMKESNAFNMVLQEKNRLISE
jgi:hypothetical protein